MDVFFVISGYLITSHIRADIQSNAFSLRDFYERRARRILPALVVVIAVTSPLAWAWLLPQDMKSFSQSAVATSLFASSAYLWHQPVFSLVKHRFATEMSVPAKLGVIVFVLALASSTYRWVEQPFRDRARMPTRRVAAMLGGATAIFVLLGVSGHLFNGYPGRFPMDSRLPADLDLASSENGWCFYSIDSDCRLPLKPNPGGRFVGMAADPGGKALLLGDSHAGQYEPFWDVLGKSGHWKVECVTTNWCFPASGKEFTGYAASPAYRQCEYNRAYAQREIPVAKAVVLGGSWGAIRTAGPLDAVFAFIRDAAARAPLVVVMPTPVQYDLSRLAFHRKSVMYGNSLGIEDLSRRRGEAAMQADAQIAAFVKGLSNVTMLPRGDAFGSRSNMRCS